MLKNVHFLMSLINSPQLSSSLRLFWNIKLNKSKDGRPPGVSACRNPGLNQGPSDLQSDALPTELFRPTNTSDSCINSVNLSKGCTVMFCSSNKSYFPLKATYLLEHSSHKISRKIGEHLQT